MLLNRKTLNDQVIEIILGKIRDGELKPGERLDSQDELAVKLGVSRSTVREAFSKLASMGVIDILHGQGTFVKKVQDYSYMDNLLASLNLLDKDSILHVLEVRKVIESSTVQLAAEKADE
ncbi:MAG: GntR family transcriptional regulator, partial [Bacillota bacterium]|nr:GntR family transcriptional regulator [Bacillota bacterium]